MYRNLKEKALLSLFALTLTVIAYSYIVKINYNELLKIKIQYLIAAFVFAISSLVLSAVRFHILTQISLKNSIITWFTSQLVSNITPTHSGGEIVRAYVIYSSSKNLSYSLAIVLAEIFSDVVVPNLVALFFSLYYLLAVKDPLFIGPLIASLYSITAWSLVILKRGFFKRIVRKVLSKLRIEVKEKPVFERKVITRTITISLVFSVLKLLLMGFSAYFAYAAVSVNVTFLECIKAYSLAMALGIIPLPAGAIGVEAGFSLVKPGLGVVLWRIATYYLITLFTLPFALILIHKKISY